ncbi:MAG TPA: hypothetical protein VM662_03385 [Sphingomonas sp.]|nr:hypothetical protein [Sphingomonas sp.]
MADRKDLSEGGAKDRGSALQGPDDDPALRNEGRQAVKNQGKATPDDYPEANEAARRTTGS